MNYLPGGQKEYVGVNFVLSIERYFIYKVVEITVKASAKLDNKFPLWCPKFNSNFYYISKLSKKLKLYYLDLIQHGRKNGGEKINIKQCWENKDRRELKRYVLLIS